MDVETIAITIGRFLTFPPISLLPHHRTATIQIILYCTFACSVTLYDGILNQVFEFHLFCWMHEEFVPFIAT